MLVVIGAPIFPKPPAVIGHSSSPLAGTSTSRAEVISAGPPGTFSRFRCTNAAHFCTSLLGCGGVAGCRPGGVPVGAAGGCGGWCVRVAGAHLVALEGGGAVARYLG